jgi:hypothetical protein
VNPHNSPGARPAVKDCCSCPDEKEHALAHMRQLHGTEAMDCATRIAQIDAQSDHRGANRSITREV